MLTKAQKDILRLLVDYYTDPTGSLNPPELDLVSKKAWKDIKKELSK